MENNTLKKTKKFRKILFPLVVFFALAATVVAGYFYIKLNKLEQNPQAIAQKEVSDLVSKVSKLMVLPTRETPTVATVSDQGLLKDQIFFAQAERGDKVLIYAQAKKAILYRVSLNKIVNVTSLNIDTVQKSK